MSTTVTYKGETLTTVENQTRTLQTAGKYLEGDIILTDETGGGSVETNTVSDLYASAVLYYTDASMHTQTATEIMNKDLPVGTLIVVYNQGPTPYVSRPSGVIELASYGSVAKGQYIIYKVVPASHVGGGND